MSPIGFFGPKTGHQPLYAELCRFLKIDRKVRTLLDAVVQNLNMRRPGELFLDPVWLQKATALPDFTSDVNELNQFCQTFAARPDNTIKFLAKSENPAAMELLLPLLNSSNERIRDAVFGSLYLKKDPATNLLLFQRFLKDEAVWKESPAVTDERLAKLAETAFNQPDWTLRGAASLAIAKHKLYETFPMLLVHLEGPDPEVAKLSATLTLKLTEAFYDALLNAPSATARRDLDRRREWLAQQLDGPVRRYSVHGFEEPIRALMMIAKKEYPTIKALMQDFHSAASKKMFSLLEKGEHPSFLRFLFLYLGDASSPALVDGILTSRSDELFVRKLLESVGSAPTLDFKTALKRFKGFEWFKPDNPKLAELVDGLEPAAVQLLVASGMPKEEIFKLLRFFLERPAAESRRAVAESLRLFVGDEVNDMILSFSSDPDPLVCVSLLKLMKSRGIKEADGILLRMVDRPEPEIRQTIYNLMPDLHADVFAGRIGQMTENTAKTLGRMVRLVDPNTQTLIADEIGSMIPVRRTAACDVIRATGFGTEFEQKLIQLAEEDSDTNVRIAAINALAQVLTVSALETLKHLTDDRGMSIHEAAADAVQTWFVLYQENAKS